MRGQCSPGENPWRHGENMQTPHHTVAPAGNLFFFFFSHLQHYNGITLVKDYYIPTVEYYSGIKRNKVLIHPITWMNLKNIMLHERSQTPKVTHNV